MIYAVLLDLSSFSLIKISKGLDLEDMGTYGDQSVQLCAITPTWYDDDDCDFVITIHDIDTV